MQLWKLFGIAAIALISGCGKNHLPKDVLETAIKGDLPAYLAIVSIEMEPTINSEGAGQVKFKAVVAPKENLYRIERVIPGDPDVTLLEITQATGSDNAIYGSAEVSRIVDNWTVARVKFQSGMRQLGNPIGNFPSNHFANGSSDAKDALRLQADNAKAKEIKRQEEIARQEMRLAEAKTRLAEAQAKEKADQLEREAREREDQIRRAEEAEQRAREQRIADAKKKQEIEAERQAIKERLNTGARFTGTISNDLGQEEGIRMRIIQRTDSSLRIAFVNPKNEKVKRYFDGELVFIPEIKVLLSSIQVDSRPRGLPMQPDRGSSQYFYFGDAFESDGSIELVLRPSVDGLEGGGDNYHLTLSKEVSATANRKETGDKKQDKRNSQAK